MDLVSDQGLQPDLFKSDHSGPSDSGDSPDIYMGVSGNPDLQF